MTIKVLAPAAVTALPGSIVSVDDRVAERLIAAGKAETAAEPKPVRKTAAKKPKE